MSVQGKLFLLKNNLIILIVLFTLSSISYSQSSRNGCLLRPKDTLHILYIFAEVLNDSVHDYNTDNPVWRKGQLPSNFEEVIDYKFTGEENIQGFITKYFYEASFGRYIVLGDYIDTLIKINMDTLTNSGYIDGYDQCLNFLNNLPDSILSTKHGHTINSNYFDLISNTSYLYQYKNHPISPDGKIDLIAFVWRTNSNITKIDNSGYGTYSSSYSLKGKTTSHILNFRSSINKPSVSRHEFAHKLVGGNSYHSGGAGAGYGTYLSDMGGFSILSSWNRNLECLNPWDRWWSGWKNPVNQYYISARKPSDNSELNCNLSYGQNFPEGTNEFILRDFLTYGDAIRIELPYIDSTTTKEQWIWIENHQLLEGNTDAKSCVNKGIYAHLQIGNNDTSNFSNSRTNYMSPLNRFGNFDFTYDTYQDSLYKIITNSTKQNPLTGYHISMLPAFNYIDPNGSDYDKIYNKEYLGPAAVEYNEILLSEENFCYDPYTYPFFGSIYDAFIEGDKIGVGTNPSSATVLTYYTNDRFNYSPPYSSPASNDNRKIYLNGLSIEFIDQLENGDIKVKIRWDDFNVAEDRRWCGDIVLNEKVILTSGKTIILDQGLTPTKPVNPIAFDGQKVFADPTAFTCKNGSYFEVNDDAKLIIKGNSTFSLEGGSELIIKGDGKITVNDGSIIEAESGVSITVQDNNSTIDLKSGSSPDICYATFYGNGNIDGTPVNRSFQSQSLYGTAEYKAWNKIECIQNVTIASNANITFIAKDQVIINGPFVTESNAVFKISMDCPE
jgi:hypothetical protein